MRRQRPVLVFKSRTTRAGASPSPVLDLAVKVAALRVVSPSCFEQLDQLIDAALQLPLRPGAAPDAPGRIQNIAKSVITIGGNGEGA